MKKLILSFVLVAIFISMAGIGMATPSKQSDTPASELGLPENAQEIAPGLLYLGESQDTDGKTVKGYAFVHYNKKSEKDVFGAEQTTTTSTCYGFIWEGIKWNTIEGYVINPENTRGLDATTMLDVFDSSVSTWEYAGNEISTYDIIGDGSIDYEAPKSKRLDGINSVRFGNLPGSAIAVTYIWTDKTQLVEWDQIYDDKSFDWSLDCGTDDCTSKMDFQNIATHELGHAIGLGDLYTELCNEQTMYGYSWYGDTSRIDLAEGDITGLNILYG